MYWRVQSVLFLDLSSVCRGKASDRTITFSLIKIYIPMIGEETLVDVLALDSYSWQYVASASDVPEYGHIGG